VTEERARPTGASRDLLLRRRRRVRVAGAVVLLLASVAMAYASTRTGTTSRGASAPPERPEAACGASAPPEAQPGSYSGPREVLEPDVDYAAVIETSCGPIEIDLLENRAPGTVNNFLFLARNDFYDGLTWHRIVEGFVIQTGDPDGINGHSPDGPGYTIPDEFQGLEGRDYTFGAVAMANTGQPDTGGSQFFIVVQPEGPAGLDPLYSLFVRVVNSRSTLLDIAAKATKEGDDPALMDTPRIPIYIDDIRIIER
jgi:cyclophilin family peptidyl-prolyl cis-trans isomerase